MFQGGGTFFVCLVFAGSPGGMSKDIAEMLRGAAANMRRNGFDYPTPPSTPEVKSIVAGKAQELKDLSESFVPRDSSEEQAKESLEKAAKNLKENFDLPPPEETKQKLDVLAHEGLASMQKMTPSSLGFAQQATGHAVRMAELTHGSNS